MTKMFGGLTSAGLEKTTDRLGGGGVLDTDFYTGTVKLAYAGKSSGGATSITVHLDLDGREYRETFYITNKAGENFFIDKKDPKKKQPMPGFVSVDELCLLTTGFPLEEQTAEDKVVKIYDFEQKKEIPTNVPVLIDVIGKKVSAAIVRQTVDKQKKDTSGEYRNTGETRDENVVDKFFHAESARTVNEIRDGIETGIFAGKWTEKNKGITRNKAKGSEGKTGTPGAATSGGFQPSAGNQAAQTRPSLFGPK
ncbi:MAG: hypothetical protein ACT4OK_10920 [Gemmobacter sp.]